MRRHAQKPDRYFFAWAARPAAKAARRFSHAAIRRLIDPRKYSTVATTQNPMAQMPKIQLSDMPTLLPGFYLTGRAARKSGTRAIG